MKELATPQQLADQYKVESKKINTKTMYLSAVKKYLSWCIRHGCGADKGTLLQFLEAEKQAGLKWASLRLYRYAVQAYFLDRGIELSRDRDLNNFFKAMKNTSPVKQVKQKQARALSADRLLYAIEQIDDIRYRALFLLMYRGGFRISEIVSISTSDLRVENDFLIVTLDRSKTGEQIKYIKLPPDTKYCPYAALVRWIDYKGIVEGRIFDITPRSVNKAIKKYFGDDYSAHSFRVGAAVNKAEMGEPARATIALLGWSSYAMYQLYTKSVDIKRMAICDF